jgi:hypothetical protein
MTLGKEQHPIPQHLRLLGQSESAAHLTVQVIKLPNK